MTGVFLSYRRDDSAAATGRLYDRLARRLGRDQVFQDVDTLPLGEDFDAIVASYIDQADVVLIVIGPGWLTASDDAGRHRLSQPDDPVATEIRTALANDGATVVPVLVDGATMPTEAELPEDLRPLVGLNGFAIRQDRFDLDVAALFDKLGLPPRRRVFMLGVAALVVAGAIAAVGLIVWGRQEPTVMAGDFNVAVAAVDVADGVDSADGRELAEFLTGRLAGELDGLGLEAQVWGPDETGPIEGATPAERAEAAADRAALIGADVVVFGVITAVDGASESSAYQPEFHFDQTAIEMQPSLEIDGTFGPVTVIPRPFGDQLDLVDSPGFSARVNAMSKTVVGLSYSTVGNHQEALTWYREALKTPGWAVADGHAVVHLLAGNAQLSLAFVDDDYSAVETSRASFDAADKADPGLVRAAIGLAAVDYLTAAGSLRGPFDAVDEDLLADVQDRLEAIVRTMPPDRSPEVLAAARFNLGQAHLVEFLAATSDGWGPEAERASASAEAAYTAIVEQYDELDQPETIAALAARAHARLGLLSFERWALSDGDLEEARRSYEAAVAIAPPPLRFQYQGDLAEVVSIEQPCEATVLFADAAGAADLYGRQDLRSEYQIRRDEEADLCESIGQSTG
ncbi:MAG: toll/interleukin-1 receptor domain-containing protein [Actinomycetota bacterium]